MAERRRKPRWLRRGSVYTPFGWVRIREAELSSDIRGEWWRAQRLILLNRSHSERTQRLTLLHELMHVVEDALIASGVLSNGITHDFMTYGDSLLYELLQKTDLVKRRQ